MSENKKKEARACLLQYGPTACSYGEYISNRAAGYAVKKEGKKETERRSVVRHFLWQMLVTALIGEEFAKFIGDSHEEFSANTKWESDLDQKVNQYARKYAVEHRGEIWDRIRNSDSRIEQGYIRPGVRGGPSRVTYISDSVMEYYYWIAVYHGCAQGFITRGC